MRVPVATFVVPLLLLASACSSETDEAAVPKPVSEKQAIDVLRAVSDRSDLNPEKFCKEVAYQVESCKEVRKQATDSCLQPGSQPRVLRSARIEATDETDGGRVLEVEGRTAGGQKYVSEFFVTAPDGAPQASVGVYWTGAGLADSPFGDENKILPKPEC
ncbi:hypothetical protein OG582_38795 (plasmid) [Streptomyces anulatus]|uniref:hypothetical protein n=1 Tax=Streptomyces anulatus TaxID=1892 RepID=UPI002F909610|nr:hypothetical protein OH737_39150 [Streptomyces anulatus]